MSGEGMGLCLTYQANFKFYAENGFDKKLLFGMASKWVSPYKVEKG